MLRAAREQLSLLFYGIVAALLPAPENRNFGWRCSLDVAPFSLAVGVLEAVSGALLFFFGGFAYLGAVDKQTMQLLSNWYPGLTRTHFMGVGALNWLAWFLHPLAWIFAILALTGITRCAAYVASREAVGEPLVWLVLRTGQALTRVRWVLQRRSLLGPAREDRVTREADGTLVIFSSRERPEWSEAITLDFAGAYFRLLDAYECAEGAWRVLAYRFRPARDNELIRRLVRYTPLAIASPIRSAND